MMKNVLVIGSTGQIGSELTMKIRREIPGSTVVAGYIPGAEPKGVLLESGPAELADVRDAAGLAAIVQKYSIDTIYNLAALLSAVAEKKPLLAWDIQMNGLLNILEVAREKKCAVFTPSSIGSFGPETPHVGTPQDTIQRPRSMYGVTKVATELLSDYYFHKYGVDHAAVQLMEADPSRLVHRNSFNIASMSFEPETLFSKIREYIPGLKVRYEVDPVRQAIANSWPDSMDDSCARAEWDWKPTYDLDSMTVDMIDCLRKKLL